MATIILRAVLFQAVVVTVCVGGGCVCVCVLDGSREHDAACQKSCLARTAAGTQKNMRKDPASLLLLDRLGAVGAGTRQVGA